MIPRRTDFPAKVVLRVFFLVGQAVTHSIQAIHSGEVIPSGWDTSIFMGQTRSHLEQEMHVVAFRFIRKRGGNAAEDGVKGSQGAQVFTEGPLVEHGKEEGGDEEYQAHGELGPDGAEARGKVAEGGKGVVGADD